MYVRLRILFNYLQLISYAILSATSLPSSLFKMSTVGRYARVQTFAKVVDGFVDRRLWQVIPDLLLL